MDWVDVLHNVIPRSVNHTDGRATPADWREVEQRTGHEVPHDYKVFVAEWGHGVLGDFIYFFSPTSCSPALAYDWGVVNFTQSYQLQKTDYPAEFPLPLLPAVGSFLPFAITDNGDWLGWIVAGDSDDWQVAIIGSDVGDAELFNLPFHKFILAMARGELAPESFPRSAQSKPMGFHPLIR